MLKLISNGKGIILAPVEYSPKGKSIMAPMKHTPMIYNLNEKGMVLWKILFRSSNGHGER